MGGSHASRRVRVSLDRRLRLYESAVQQPVAEVVFLERAYRHGRGADAWPRTLREDFAGTCAAVTDALFVARAELLRCTREVFAECGWMRERDNLLIDVPLESLERPAPLQPFLGGPKASSSVTSAG